MVGILFKLSHHYMFKVIVCMTCMETMQNLGIVLENIIFIYNLFRTFLFLEIIYISNSFDEYFF